VGRARCEKLGNLGDVTEMLRTAKDRGIRVIIDLRDGQRVGVPGSRCLRLNDDPSQ
jgi:hypothetical protein